MLFLWTVIASGQSACSMGLAGPPGLGTESFEWAQVSHFIQAEGQRTSCTCISGQAWGLKTIALLAKH